MNTMTLPNIETQGNKVRRLCIEVLDFSNNDSEKEFEENSQE